MLGSHQDPQVRMWLLLQCPCPPGGALPTPAAGVPGCSMKLVLSPCPCPAAVNPGPGCTRTLQPLIAERDGAVGRASQAQEAQILFSSTVSHLSQEETGCSPGSCPW